MASMKQNAISEVHESDDKNCANNGIIILVHNDESFTETRQILREKGINIPVYNVKMREDEKLLQHLIANEGTKVVICKGITVSRLRRQLNIPIIEIRYNFSEFLFAAKKAVKISKRIGIIGFNHHFLSCNQLSSVLDFDMLEVRVLSDHALAGGTIAELKAKGIEVIIGGSRSVMDEACRQGLYTVMMDLNVQSILDAIDDAQHIYQLEMEKKKQMESVAKIYDLAQEGIIGADKAGFITTINLNAERQFGTLKSSVGKHIDSLLPPQMAKRIIQGDSVYGEIVNFGKTKVIVTSVPTLVENNITGTVITVQDINKVQNMEYEIRKKLQNKGHVAKNHFSNIIGNSPAINDAKEKAMQFARVDSTVLITGETGTGKELFAQSIHNFSTRRKNPFVAINCAALPENILESELFGYVKGAFTGARPEGKMGIFELAHTGTILLDEVSEISLSVQARLLRVIQEREISRIGGESVIPVDVRIIASTNRNLFAAVEKNLFREDLYYRLNVLNLKIPSLRERQSDIPLLAAHFVKIFSEKFSKSIVTITPDAFDVLSTMPFPGNIRQLNNIMECAVALCGNSIIDKALIDEVLTMNEDNVAKRPVIASAPVSRPNLSDVERTEILLALKQANGNKTIAARMLGIGYTTLWRKLKSVPARQ
jgi:transcriptional regulator with PAS, ATPase and Fis domain